MARNTAQFYGTGRRKTATAAASVGVKTPV